MAMSLASAVSLTHKHQQKADSNATLRPRYSLPADARHVLVLHQHGAATTSYDSGSSHGIKQVHAVVQHVGEDVEHRPND